MKFHNRQYTIPLPLLVEVDDSEAPGGLEADDDNWQLFVFVQDDVTEVPATTAATPATVRAADVAKLLGGLEGIGSTCQTNKNIIIIWPNKLFRCTAQTLKEISST